MTKAEWEAAERSREVVRPSAFPRIEAAIRRAKDREARGEPPPPRPRPSRPLSQQDAEDVG